MSIKDNMKLLVLTPQKTLFEGLVEKVELPGEKGRFMVLKSHAPLISSLVPGCIVFTAKGKEERIHINSGFVRINDDEVVACAET